MKKKHAVKNLRKTAFSKARLLAFVLVFAGIGAYLLVHSFAASPTSANLWIDTTGGTCTRQATAGAYNDAQACNSVQAAMTAAQGGDTVIIKNGTYPSQTITSGTKASVVSFYAETASQVLLTGGLSIDGVDRIHITGVISAGSGETRSDLSICDTNCTSFTTTDILVDGWHGKSAFMRATGVTIQNSEFGSFSACNASDPEDGVRFWDGTGGSSTPTNDKFLYNIVHDVDAGSGDTCQGTTHAGYHVDCMQNNGGSNITLEGNIFYNCPTSNIQWNPFGGATIGPQVLQNNFFGPTHCCNALVLGSQSAGTNCSAIVARNNVIYGDINPGGGCTGGSIKAYNNIIMGSGSSCNNSQVAYSYNIFATAWTTTCGTNAKKCNPVYTTTLPSWGGGQPDPHLSVSDTCAKDAGDPVNFAPTDIDGDDRPQGALSDAGPDEVMAVASPTSNVWVSTTGNDATCVRGDQTKPCLTFQKAYQIASCGDTVSVAAGSYPIQSITATKACTPSTPIVFAGSGAINIAAGGGVFGGSGLDVNGGNYVTLQNMNVADRFVARGGAAYVTFQNINAPRLAILGPADHISVLGGSIGPYDDSSLGGNGGSHIYPETGTSNGPTNILIDGVNFHDYTCSTNCISRGIHGPDCLSDSGSETAVSGGPLTIRNSTFTNCKGYDVLIRSTFHADTIGAITLQNNYFGATGVCADGCADTSDVPDPVEISCNDSGGNLGNIMIQFNSFDRQSTQGNSFDLGPSQCNTWNASTIIVKGNVFNSINSGECGHQTQSFNVVVTDSCSIGTNKVSSSAITEYTNRLSDPVNFDLSSGSAPAVDAGGSSCPATDIHGQARPQGSACDAGADEFATPGSGPIPGDLNNDGHVTILDLSILLSHYGQAATPSQGDINGDGIITILDLSMLLSHYGT